MKTKNNNLLLQKPALVERYIRLRMYKNAKRLSRFVMRRLLSYRERNKERVLANAIIETAKQITKSRKYGFESSAIVLNLGLFFLIAERDIQAVKIDALTHPDSWKRSLCARVILLTIHELDMDKVAGGRLRAALTNAGVSEQAREQVTEALRNIRNAQQKAQKKFAFLRNATIAHRDPDALLQYQSISRIDELEVLRIVAEFYDGTRLFLNVISGLLLEVGTLPGLINQLRSRTQ